MSNPELRMLEKGNWPGGWKEENTEVREDEKKRAQVLEWPEMLPGRQLWKNHSKSEVFTLEVVSEYPVAGQTVR